MSFFDDQEPSSTPKLALFSFPLNNREREPLGMATPPVNAAASVPFHWEEAPGKPRLSTTSELKGNGVVRCLELPPRLLSSTEAANKVANETSPSPTTVLEGPYVGGRTVSFGKGGALVKEKGQGLFGSRRWGSFRKNREVFGEGSFRFCPETDGRGGGVGAKVKITRLGRKSSFLSLSLTKSHFLASIYEGFKQVIPWSRRQEKIRRMSSSRV